MPFAVVEFKKEKKAVAAVPLCWIKTIKNVLYCSWPGYLKSNNELNKAATNSQQPNHLFSRHEVAILKQFDSIGEARKAEKRYIEDGYNSKLSFSKENLGRGKRRIAGNRNSSYEYSYSPNENLNESSIDLEDLLNSPKTTTVPKSSTPINESDESLFSTAASPISNRDGSLNPDLDQFSQDLLSYETPEIRKQRKINHVNHRQSDGHLKSVADREENLPKKRKIDNAEQQQVLQHKKQQVQVHQAMGELENDPNTQQEQSQPLDLENKITLHDVALTQIRILKEISEIKSILQQIKRPNFTLADAPAIPVALPINTQENFNEFEVFLQEKNNLKAMITYLQHYYSRESKQFIRNLFKKLVEDSVLLKYNYVGKGTKLKFKGTNMEKLIFCVLRTSGIHITADEFKSNIQFYLKYSFQRYKIAQKSNERNNLTDTDIDD